MNTLNQKPLLGFGLGLRRELIKPILEQQPPLDWLEILSDHYLDADNGSLDELLRLRAIYPMVMHCGDLSLGGPDPLDQRYLGQLKELASNLEPAWISDHLCWTMPGMSHSYDLRPLPRTREMIDYLLPRIGQVQETLGRRILLENVSGHHIQSGDQMPEWEFVARVAEESDSLILLDINNIISNSVALGLDARDYIAHLPADRIWQVHLSPLVNRDEHERDTDTGQLQDPVWYLYLQLIRHCGPIATMLERNDGIPPLEELIDELQAARNIAAQI